LLSDTCSECCSRFFASSEDCIYKSINPMTQVEEGSSCRSYTKKRQCNQDISCSWNEATNVCSGNTTNDESNSCELLENKRQCKQNNSCHWDDTASVCSVKNATMHPSLRPTNQSITINESATCQTFKNKRQCNQDDSCSWDEDTAKCS
jgi:hypothetical protein